MSSSNTKRMILRLALLLATASAAFAATVPALAADPDVGAQYQLASAFEHCQRGSPEKYFELRDYAFKVDGALRNWKGSVGGKKQFPVPSNLARCDREMPQAQAKAKAAELVMKAYDALESRAREADGTRERLAAYRAARAEFVRLNGGSTSLSRDGLENASSRIARWDRELVERVQMMERAAAERAAAEQRRAKEAADRERQKRQAWASLKGDRLAVAKKQGLPPGMSYAEMLRAAQWSYPHDVVLKTVDTENEEGDIDTETHTAPCEIVYEFRGNALAKTSRHGPGCKYER
jgi:hypothetical protein